MKYSLSSIILLLFLFPLGIKGLHMFSHVEEEHCAEHETTHLHEKHHDCKICEFSCDTESEFFSYSNTSCEAGFYELPSSLSSFIHQSVFLSPSLRAPPMAS